MLRTRAMREKDEQREMRKYNYTLLRVRFPDGYILQGKGTPHPSLRHLQKLLRVRGVEGGGAEFGVVYPTAVVYRTAVV